MQETLYMPLRFVIEVQSMIVSKSSEGGDGLLVGTYPVNLLWFISLDISVF